MFSRKNTWVIAHRGDSGNYPENSLKAFWAALESKADIIELDLQLTADNQIVVFHDKTINRIFQTNTGDTIKDLKLKKLKEWDIGRWFSEEFSGMRIPTLEEVVNSLPKFTPLILELKNNEEKFVFNVINQLDDLKKELGIGYISVRDTETYNRAKEVTDNYKIGLMQKKRTPRETLDIIMREEIEILQIRWRDWTSEEWGVLLETDTIITAFYADEIEDFRFLVPKKINGILTNYPAKLAEFLKKK
ncbi:MAG: glycerophosphodiester phosphodiesterase [Candidatus Thorarchaeota archaeon]